MNAVGSPDRLTGNQVTVGTLIRPGYGCSPAKAAYHLTPQGGGLIGSLTEETTVGASPEATFAYITDQSRLHEWNVHVTSAEVVGGGPVVEGARLLHRRRRNNRDFTLTFTVQAHEPPIRHVVTGSVFGVATMVTFEVSPAEAGSRVVMRADVTGRGLRRLLAPIVAREMRKSTTTALAALHERLK